MDTPIENIEKFMEEGKLYGTYPVEL